MPQTDLELLRALARLQANDDMADGLSVASHWVLCLTGGQLRHFALIYLLGLLDTQAYRRP